MQGVDNVIIHLPGPTPDLHQIAISTHRGQDLVPATGPTRTASGSLRTTSSRADAGRAMQRMLGHKGKGGGHGTMAGGWLPIERPDELEAQQKMLSERLLRILGKDPQRLAPIRLADPVQPGAPSDVSGGNPTPALG